MERLTAGMTILSPRDVIEMLSVGRRLLDDPELDLAYRKGDLSWYRGSKVRALPPHLDASNVAKWIEKAIPMTSNAVERAISRHRDPSVGGPTRAVHFRSPATRAWRNWRAARGG